MTATGAGPGGPWNAGPLPYHPWALPAVPPASPSTVLASPLTGTRARLQTAKPSAAPAPHMEVLHHDRQL